MPSPQHEQRSSPTSAPLALRRSSRPPLVMKTSQGSVTDSKPLEKTQQVDTLTETTKRDLTSTKTQVKASSKPKSKEQPGPARVRGRSPHLEETASSLHRPSAAQQPFKRNASAVTLPTSPASPILVFHIDDI